jgi:Zn-dependent protease with chaperone function
MLLVPLLLAFAVALVLASPLVLTAGRWQVRLPRLALTLWFGSFALGCAAAGGSVVVSVMASLSASSVSGAGGVVVTIAAWVSLVVIGAVIAGVAAAAEPLNMLQRDEVESLTPLVSSREQRKGFVLGRVDGEHPVACAVPGPGSERMILISSGLESALTTAQVQAVLAHEWAHLRGRHHWAMRIANLNAACLPPFLPAGRALRRATRLLIELVADDTAARQTGAVNLANALARLGALSGDSGMDLRAERLTMRRWRPSRPHRVPVAVRL